MSASDDDGDSGSDDQLMRREDASADGSSAASGDDSRSEDEEDSSCALGCSHCSARRSRAAVRNMLVDVILEEDLDTLRAIFSDIIDFPCEDAEKCRGHAYVFPHEVRAAYGERGMAVGLASDVMIVAVEEGLTDIVRELHKYGADHESISAPLSPGHGSCWTYDGLTPIMVAAKIGDVEMVKLLAELGADVRQTAGDEDGCTAMHIASMRNEPLVIRAQHEPGADLNQLSSGVNPAPPIYFALDKCDDPYSFDAIRELHRLGADMSAGGFGRAATPAHYIAECGRPQGIKAIRLLHELGTDFRRVGSGGFTLMHEAALGGNVEIIRFVYGVLGPGSVAQCLTAMPWPTPVDCAVRNGHEAAVRLFCEELGVMINGYDAKGKTRMHRAVRAAICSFEMMRLLVELGADINKGSSVKGTTPAISAVRNGRAEAVANLLELGADFERRDNAGRTPLSYAVRANNQEIIEMIVSAPLRYGRHPLQAERGALETAAARHLPPDLLRMCADFVYVLPYFAPRQRRGPAEEVHGDGAERRSAADEDRT